MSFHLHKPPLKPTRAFRHLADALYDQLLKSCNGLASLKQIHSSLTTTGFVTKWPHLSAKIIIKYARFGYSNKARSLFDNACIDGEGGPSSFLSNAMLRAYVNNGHYFETLELYSLMRRTCISSNNYTFPSVLKACASKSLIREGKVVHGDATKNGFGSDLYVEAALLDMYAKCGLMEDVGKIFDEMPMRDLVCWTAMITACELAEKPKQALLLFQNMLQEGVLADPVAILTVGSAVGQLGEAASAHSVHAYAICNGFLGDICVGNSLIAMYAKCGDVESARLVFDQMEERDGISWNSMLSGYTQNGKASEALVLFDQMKDSGCKPDAVTVLILASACAYLGSCNVGRKLHDYITENITEIDSTLWNALMDMYSKCGDLDTAVKMFNDIHPSNRDVTSWNILISGYGMHGYGKEALEFFSGMLEEGIRPDHITFTSVLSACSHAGLINEGQKCFADMGKFTVVPQMKHLACVVDMLGRAGLLHEAFDIIKQMPSPPNDEVWGALLLACKIHGNAELGETAADNLFELEPEHSGYYVLMSNVYAASNKWQEVGKLRQDMRVKGLKKPASFSVIELGNVVHAFHTADQENLHWQEIHDQVENLTTEMKMAGYAPNLSCVLHDDV